MSFSSATLSSQISMCLKGLTSQSIFPSSAKFPLKIPFRYFWFVELITNYSNGVILFCIRKRLGNRRGRGIGIKEWRGKVGKESGGEARTAGVDFKFSFYWSISSCILHSWMSWINPPLLGHHKGVASRGQNSYVKRIDYLKTMIIRLIKVRILYRCLLLTWSRCTTMSPV